MCESAPRLASDGAAAGCARRAAGREARRPIVVPSRGYRLPHRAVAPQRWPIVSAATTAPDTCDSVGCRRTGSREGFNDGRRAPRPARPREADWHGLGRPVPGHEDRDPSLSIAEGADGRVLLKCHAGCAVQDIVSALGLRMADLYPDARTNPPGRVQHRNTAPQPRSPPRIRVLRGATSEVWQEGLLHRCSRIRRGCVRAPSRRTPRPRGCRATSFVRLVSRMRGTGTGRPCGCRTSIVTGTSRQSGSASRSTATTSSAGSSARSSASTG